VTGVQLAEKLVHLGLDECERSAKAALFDEALRGLSALDARTPGHAWWVPGRLEVFGKHTDYAGGRTLVAALPRGFAFVAELRSDLGIHILDAHSGERLVLDRRPADCTGWRHYVEVVVGRLARNFPGAWRGANLVFASDLPRAAGMSSSSALLVGVATALARLWDLTAREEWRRNIDGRVDTAMYYACLENGRTFRELAGDSGVGTFGGSEDHTAMLTARAGSVSAFSYIPVRAQGEARLPDNWRFVIASSGVAAEKTGSARGAYNRLSEGVDVLLRLWNDVSGNQDSLAAALSSDDSAIERLLEQIAATSVAGWPRHALRRRLEHFVAEDAIVPGALRAFQDADVNGLGRLSEMSQHHAEDLLGNQIPETSALAREARAAGAFAACSFGAGFGGSVWALVERERAVDFADVWLNRYRIQHPMPAAARFIATPGPPVVEMAV
jgi:galactokinase